MGNLKEKSALRSEVLSESVDDRFDNAGQLMDRFNQRLRLGNLRLVDRYLEGKLQLRVHFCIREVDEEVVAYLQGAKWVRRSEEGRNLGKCPTQHLRHASDQMAADVHTAKLRPDRDQFAMLGEVVQLIQDPQVVPFPSLVCFDREQIGDDHGRLDSLYF